jgi:GTPase Era involved in 16S rRNA processing
MSEGEIQRLRDFTLAKQQVTALVRAVRQYFHDAKETPRDEQCQALLVKLAEDRFNLAVLGQFKRGKSSLMNAVIGRNLLPTGLLPLTSVITALCYGPREQIVLKRKGWAIDEHVALNQLPLFVSESGNPGNQRGIIEARVEIPSPFLRRGLYFIDTPGVGSAQQGNTATTYAFLPQADAVIFVTSVEAPLSEAEEGFLRDIRQYVRRLFVVVNKVDLLAEHEREQVLGYIRAGIARTLETGAARLYPLSAKQGLEAKLRADAEGVRQSGLQAFEADLTAFLTEEKSQVFLTAILDRLLRLLPEAGETNSSTELCELRASAERLSAALAQGAMEQVAHAESAPSADTGALERAMRREQAAPPRKERPAERRVICPVCTAQGTAVFDFFAQWQYNLGQTEEARDAFAAARGFCHVHTWQFQQMASSLTIAEGYAALVEAATAHLRQSASRPAAERAALLESLLPRAENCAPCRLQRETASAEIARLLAELAAPEARERYARTLGLCLPHLCMALAAAPDQAIAEFLANQAMLHLEEIAEDMHSFVLKRDALRRGLINDHEESAWWRALVQLIGERTAQYYWPELPEGGVSRV